MNNYFRAFSMEENFRDTASCCRLPILEYRNITFSNLFIFSLQQWAPLLFFAVKKILYLLLRYFNSILVFYLTSIK
jgi:hypothetical protein